MNDIELLVKRTAITAAANLSTAVAPIVLLPLLTKTLTIEDYGIWTLVVVTASLLPMIVMLGLPNALVRFLASSKNADEIREQYYSMALIILAADLFVSFLLLLLARPIATYLLDNNYTLALLLPAISFFASYNYLPLAYFRTFQQARRFSRITFLQAILYVAFVGLFVALGFGVVGAALGFLVMQVLVSLISSYVVVSDIGISIPQLKRAKAHLKYSLPFVPRDLSSWALNVSDRYIIGLFLGLAWVGYYSPGYTLGSMLTLLAAPFTIILPSVMYQHYDENNIVLVKSLIRYSLKYFLAMAIPCAFLVSVLAKPILTVLSTRQIAEAGYAVTPFVAVSAVLLGVYAIIVIVLTLEKKTRIIGSTWIMAAGLNISLNLIFVRYFGIIVAAMTTLLAYAFVFAVTTFYSIRIVQFSFDGPFILKSILASAIVSILALMLHASTLLGLVASLAICGLIYVIILFALRSFAANEIAFFRRFLPTGH